MTSAQEALSARITEIVAEYEQDEAQTTSRGAIRRLAKALAIAEAARGAPDPAANLRRLLAERERLLAEFDGSVCPACHHRAHDPGACSECPACELHTDEAAAFVLRIEPELLA